MPIALPHDCPSLLIRRTAFEQHGLTRALFDERLELTADEFRVEGDLIVVGPIHNERALPEVIAHIEAAGLTYFDDFFDLSGTWPTWLKVFAMAARK